MEEENNEEHTEVTIVCSDEKLQVVRSALKPYRTLLEGRSQFAGSNQEIGMSDVPGVVVRQIISWAERHQSDPDRPVYDSSSEKVTVTLTEDDINHLMNLDLIVLFALIQIADLYLLLDLLDGACQIAARVLEDADPVELRQILFEGDSGFTEEEENQLRKENEWIEEL